jgi:hypothetical protein
MKDPAQWPMAARDYANTRYSDLDQINTSNVSQLAAGLDVLGRRRSRTGGGAARRRRHDVCGRSLCGPLPQPRLRAGCHDRRVEMVLRRSQNRRRRAWPAATSSIADSPSTTARSSSTRSTTTPSRSMPRPARSSGTPSSARSTRRDDHDGAVVVKGKVLVGNSGGESACAAGSPRSTKTPARSPGAPIRPARQGRADRRRLQAVLRQPQGQGSRREELAGRTAGRSAAARCGAGSPTIPSST